MPLNHCTRNIEANAQPGICFSLRITNLIETFKNVLVMLFRNANAKILYRYLQTIVILSQMEKNSIRARRIFDCIGEEVGECLPQAISISIDAGPGLPTQVDLMARRDCLDILYC